MFSCVFGRMFVFVCVVRHVINSVEHLVGIVFYYVCGYLFVLLYLW